MGALTLTGPAVVELKHVLVADSTCVGVQQCLYWCWPDTRYTVSLPFRLLCPYQGTSSYFANRILCYESHGVIFYFGFSRSLVQLILAGLPLRSCLDQWGTFCAWGLSHCPSSLLPLLGLEPMQAQSIQQVSMP